MDNAKLVFAVLLLSSVPPPSAKASQPWDTPFSPDTAALLSSAAHVKAPEDQQVQILLEEHRISIRPNGRVQSTVRKVYRILAKEAVDEWSSVEEPWREEKPAIRARVITRTGSVHTLDPKTVADSPAAELDSSTFSDTRVVRAPLPAVESGAVVEYEVTTDAAPAFAEAGVARRIAAIEGVPLERFHLAIDAPRGVALKTASRQIPEPAVHRSESKTGVHIEVELGPIEPKKHFEGSLPPDVSSSPYFEFSTAAVWAELAARYSEIVDRQIQSAEVKALVEGAERSAAPLATAARLATQLHRNVRYTGVEFGDAAVVPAKPAQVLQRRFGDCKDKAALLVAMLRAVGLNANVALLRSGFMTDVDPDVPGLDLFNHAIVYVDAPQPLWIDATANDLRVGVLPTGDQGRLALVARKGSTGPVRIPEKTDTLDRHEYDVQFKDSGSGSITETMESNGPSEAFLRSAYAASDGAKSALEKYVKAAYAAKRLGTYEVAGKDDLSQPVRVTVQAVDTPQVVTGPDSANVLVGATLLIGELPFEFQRALNPTGEKDPAPARTQDFLFPEAGVTERIFRLHPPALFKVGNLPASSKVELGPLRLSQTYTTGADGTVEADYRLEIPKRRITAAEYEAICAALEKHGAQFADRINFVPETAELLAVGQTGKALALMKESVAKRDGDASAHVRLSRLLISAGLGIAGRSEAEKATALDANSSQAWQALAWALQNDSFGNLRQGDWNRPEALKALRKAVELDPEDRVAKMDLAILLEFNNRGERYGKGNSQDEATALYRELLKKEPNVVLESNLTAALFYSGRFDEAAAEARKCPDNQRVLFQAAVQAMRQGAGAAIVNLQTEVPDPATRVQFLASVAFTLMHMRRYPDALTFWQAAMRVTPNPQAAPMTELMTRLKRSEDALLPDTDPRSVEQKLLALIIGDERPSKEQLNELLDYTIKPEDMGELDSIRRQAPGAFRQLFALGLTTENMADIIVSNMNLEKEGDDAHGYKLTGSVAVSPMPAMFAVREGTGYKIIGSADSLENVGRRVLELLKRNDLDGARWWLNQSVATMSSGANGWYPAAHGIWPGSASKMRLAAASLIGRYEGAADAVAMLKEAYVKATAGFDKSQIEQALCETYAKAKQWTELAAAARRLMTSSTFHGAGFEFLVQALEEQKDWKALEAAALDEAKLKDAHKDSWKYVAIARIGSRNGGGHDAVLHLKAGSESAELDAWNEIYQKKVTLETLSAAKRTGGLGYIRDPYLVALLELGLHKPEDAQESLKQAIDRADVVTVDARAWVVFGDICEQYGFPEAAKQAWARARSAKAPNRDAQWALGTLPDSGR